MSPSSLAVVTQPQTVASFVAGREDKPQAATKESPTLIQAITELLGIPVPLVLRIKSGKYD